MPRWKSRSGKGHQNRRRGERLRSHACRALEPEPAAEPAKTRREPCFGWGRPALTGWITIKEETQLMRAGVAPALAQAQRTEQDRGVLADSVDARACGAGRRLAARAQATHNHVQSVRVPDLPPADDRSAEAEAAREARATIARAVQAKQGKLVAGGTIFVPYSDWEELLIREGEPGALLTLASNPHAAAATLAKLVAGPAVAVRRQAAGNPRTPLPPLAAAIEGEDDEATRLRAARNLLSRAAEDEQIDAARGAIAEISLTSDDAEVRAAALVALSAAATQKTERSDADCGSTTRSQR